MLIFIDYLVMWEECVLLQDIKVSGPNSISFLTNSLLLVFLYDNINSYEKALMMKRVSKSQYKDVFFRPNYLISVIAELVGVK